MSQGEAFQVGLRIGKYELTRKLGEGGFGVLFAARDTSLERDLAIKFLHPHHSSNPELVKRFVQEARSIAKVVHPGIITVYESGEVWGTGTGADGAAFIIMELLIGETLTQRMKASGGRLAPATAMEICRQIASALEAAHRQGVVHRDLKPDNVMLVKDLALTLGERAKVLDFGIAKLATASPAGATQAGMVFGTPCYMAPEQCKSAADANHSSDIYSLGCILFELVTGRTPFEGGMAELIAHHILTQPPIPSRIIPGLPSHIDDVIAAMLAKDPNNRPATMTVVEAILEERRLMPVAQKPGSGGRTRTLGGARLATNPPPIFGKPMAPGANPLPGMPPPASTAHHTPATPMPSVAAPSTTPAVGSPTTLSSAAGIAAKLERKSSAKWWIAVPIIVAAAAGTVIAIGRGGDGEPTPEPSAGSAPTATTQSAATATSTTATGSAATGSAATGSAETGSASTGSAATALPTTGAVTASTTATGTNT
ncbi:MAG: protein kinase, partial [Deltaproteobacteria bacterium]|nr:protein kinase [Deltaproteobacteria bacterium]